MKLDLRLALPAAIAWVVLAILIGIPIALPWAAVLSWALAIAALGVAVVQPSWRQRLISISVCLVVTALLLSAAAAGQHQREPDALVDAAKTGRSITFTANVTETAAAAQRQFSATATSITLDGVSRSVEVPVLVFGDPPDNTAIGNQITVTGTVQETEPGDDTAFLVFAHGDIEVTSAPEWYLSWANELRSEFRSSASSLPGDGGGLLPGLAIGDTGAVSDSLDQAMKSSSLSHLTAVSGANCAVIIGLVMLGGASLRVPRVWRIAASLIVLVAFVILVTPQPSVLRAAVMATLVLATMAAGRPISGLPLLSLAIVMLLTVDPWLARSYGFVLSVLATAGLFLLSGPIFRVLANWIPAPIAVAIAVPLSAQLACQPVLILLAPSIPTYGVIANILTAPAAPVATVLGLIACVFLPLLPGLGLVVTHIAWLPSAWIAAVANFFSRMPANSLPWPAGAGGVALAVMITTAALFLVLPQRDNRLRRMASVVLIVSCVAYSGVWGGEQLRRRLSPPADWQIAACDVGQGDAVLIRSAGKVALIDTGPEPERLEYCLDTLGISHLDLLVLTHFDLDHVGGTAAVVGKADFVLVGPSSGKDDDRIVQKLQRAGARVEHPAIGRQGLLGELRWRVLWPPAQFGSIEPGNAASVALEFQGVGACIEGCLRSVFLGDLGEESQTRLLGANSVSAVDVVKVSHHGSRDQSPRLYERLSAAVGVIGVGADNDYGHPTDGLLQTLESIGTTVARTDNNGMVLISMQDNRTQLWFERSAVEQAGPAEH